MMGRRKRNILLIVQRNNFSKDVLFINQLTKAFAAQGYEVRWHNPLGVNFRRAIDPEGRFNDLSRPIRAIVKAYTLVKSPYLWEYIVQRKSLKNPPVAERCRRLKKYITSFGKNATVVILSRSAGGLVASMIADESGIKKLICLGYPFKHPGHPVEKERYQHLPGVKTPLLIMQGTNDIYGGIEITSLYNFAPNTSVRFVETSHDFSITPEQWESVLQDINDFIATDEIEMVTA